MEISRAGFFAMKSEMLQQLRDLADDAAQQGAGALTAALLALGDQYALDDTAMTRFAQYCCAFDAERAGVTVSGVTAAPCREEAPEMIH